MSLPNVTVPLGTNSLPVTALPEDANSNPGTLAVKPSWVDDNPTQPGAPVLNVAGDGLSALVGPFHTPGVFQVDVTAQGTVGSPFTNSFNVTVEEVPATQIVFQFGTPS